MYNFNLIENEEVVKIFDEVYIKQGENEKNTTIILTNKRILFLDYIEPNQGLEVLRIARGADYIKYKDVYYQIDINDIERITNGEYFKVVLTNKMTFEFDCIELFNLLNK